MKNYFLLFFFATFAVSAQLDSSQLNVQWPVGLLVDQFNLRIKTADKPVFINFTADWCVVCKKQKPVLQQVMRELKGQVDLMVIDMESNPEIAAYFEVDGLPVTILYKDGSMVWNRVGFQDRMQLLEQVAPLLHNKKETKQ